MLPTRTLPWPIPWAAVELIARAESCRLRAYRCPANVWTIGWGETTGVRAGMVWTQEQADRALCDALVRYTAQVSAALHDGATPNELGALVSLAYNIGVGALIKSTVLKCHNRGDRQAASRAFSLWNKARVGGKLQVLNGLTARRAAESALYLAPEDDDQPEPRMPQAVAAESRLAASPITQSGAVVAGTGALSLMGDAGEHIGAVGGTVAQARSLVDTAGVPLQWILPALLIVVGGLVIWYRYKQRSGGWA